jgi:hypothetical protein
LRNQDGTPSLGQGYSPYYAPYTPPAYPAFTPPASRLVLPTPILLPSDYAQLHMFVLPIPGATGACPAPLAVNVTCTAIAVRAGETLSLLACRYETSVGVLQQMNGLGDSTVLRVGETLIVPDRAGTPIACG